jgi:hypothetical protein
MKSEAMREFINTVFEGLTPTEYEIRIIDMYETVSQVTGLPCRYQLMDISYGNRQLIRVVQVEDHTTHETAYLKVPVIEETSSCMGAIAWTFGLDEQTYNPTIQT